MKKRYCLIRRANRGGKFYCHDQVTGQRESLGTANHHADANLVDLDAMLEERMNGISEVLRQSWKWNERENQCQTDKSDDSLDFHIPEFT